MAIGFTPTATYSNLTRLELEALRKADFFAGGKALTVGDQAYSGDGVVGKGDINAEPFYTGPEVALDDILPLTPPQQPGYGIGTQSAVATGAIFAEYAQWLGPTAVYDAAASGFASAANAWDDTTPAFSFILAGVLPGDLLLVTPTENTVGVNAGVVATIQTVAANQLAVVNIWNPASSTAALSISPDKFNYTIIRPSALKLFAVPGSGPLGGEQTFLVVRPGSTLHNAAGPTLNAINADRLLNVIPPKYALDTTVDRADWVYDFGGISRSISGSERGLDTLGYRVVLYPDIGDGSGPDLTKPITSLNPTIDPGIDADKQRFTIDYKAGVIRFSCAPKLGGDIKPAGATNGTNPLTGRLNLYAVLWVVDLSLTEGNARTLYGVRTSTTSYRVPGRVVFNATTGAWEIGTTGVDLNAFYVKALGTASGASQTNPYAPVQYSTEFGTVDDTVVLGGSPRYFTYRQGSNVWRFVREESLFGYGPTDVELTVEDKTKLTLGDISNPAQAPGGDLNPSVLWDGSTNPKGARDTSEMLGRLPAALLTAPYGVAHLKKGRYYLTDKTIYVPPGSTIQGEGAATKILARVNSSAFGRVRPVFKVGPNTPWGVWDATVAEDVGSPYGITVSPTTMTTSATARVEGADLVWNPVRRVWGQVIALDTGIWFNEIGPDGAYKFSGLGVNVKDTANPAWTSLSPNSTHHTGNHYPRIAHHEHTDEYSVVWVDQVTVGGTIGPQVFYRAFSVDLNLTATTPTPSLSFKSAGFLVGQAGTFHDHPSIAIESYTTGSNYHSQVTFWEYQTDAAGLINTGFSGISRRIYQGGVAPSVTGQTTYLAAPYGVANEELGIISSTDTKWDGEARFLAVWSVRNHAVVTGTSASLSILTFTHGTVGLDLQVKGVVPGSKLHILGGATTAFGDAPPFIPTTQDGTTLTVQAASAASAVVWHDLNNTPFPDPGPLTWAITPASYIQGAFYNWASNTFSAPFNVVTGQREQNDLFYILEMDQPDFVRLSRGSDKWLVVFQGFQSTGFMATPRLKSFADSILSATFFDAAGGIPTADPVVYREHVSTCRVLLANDGSLINPSPPDKVQATSAARNTGPSVQAFYQMTTGSGTMTIGPSVLNDLGANFIADFNTVNSRWGDAKLDGATYLQINAGPNFGVWQVTSWTATSLTISGAFNAADGTPRTYVLFRSPAITEARLSRDIEVSNKSLGTRPPLTSRPNFLFSYRSPMNEAREVAAHNFMHRWDGPTQSLLPAVTWTGQDWVVVSPAKNHMRSFTGCYHPNGPNSLFADAGWYFGRGATGTRPSGTLGTLVRTFPTGAKLLDVASGLTLSIVSVYDEHTVVLSGVEPLGAADLTNREYHLILPSLPDYGGFKNQGYRVAEDGSIIASTSYITFADPPALDSKENFHRNRELMRRVFPYYFTSATSLLATRGANYPASGFVYDVIEEGSNRKGDIFFNGVAVGRPKGVNELSYLEPPVVALAWGENYFGFLDRIKAGDAGSRVQRMEFYRQSFGPYNVTFKDFALDVVDAAGLAVLSRAHVYTNHGSSRSGNVAMATDGYRNVYVYATQIQGLGKDAALPEWNLRLSRLYACYTNTEGHHPLHLEAGRPAGNGTYTNIYTWQNSPQSQSGNMLHQDRYNNQNTTTKVIWDGKRFVVAWVARIAGTSLPVGYSPFTLAIGQLSGGEDGGLQTNELVSPTDVATDLTPLGSTILTNGSGGTGLYDGSITAIDLAHSGTTYAVAWVSGCVEDVPLSGPGDQSQGGSTLGVTIFKLDNAIPNSTNPSLQGTLFPGGGQNYVLGQSQFPGTWSNPRIIWTGERYAVFAQQTNMAPAFPTDYREGDSYVVVAYCGENGPAEPTQVKQQSGRHGGFGAFFPVNNYTPLLPAASGGADLVGLGFPLTTGAFGTPAPMNGQEYTTILLTGGEGEVPIVATGTTGGALTGTVWEDLGANFDQGAFGPVRRGDFLVVTDAASSNIGIYLILSVLTSTRVLIVGSAMTFPEVATQSYKIVRPAHPNVQPGDVLVVDGVWREATSTLSTASTGHYPILTYSPKFRAIVVEGQFDPGDVGAGVVADPNWKYVIRGSIRTGASANLLVGSVLAQGRAGSTQSPIKAGDTSWLTDLLLSGSYSTDTAGFTKMAALLDVAYNAERDEYAVLFTSYTPSSDIYLWVALFDPRKRQISAAKPLISEVSGGPTETPQDWKLNWNGKHYLAAGGVTTSTVPSGLYVRGYLLSDSLAIEQTLTLDGVLTTSPPQDLLGALANQMPGTGYGSLTSLGLIEARVKNVHIAWNDKLARWTVSACVSWQTVGYAAPTTNAEPDLIPMGIVTAWPAASGLVTVGDTSYLQPGMKVGFYTIDPATLDRWNLGYVTVKRVLNLTQFEANATFDEFSTGLGSPIDLLLGTSVAFAYPREDVYTWTVGYGAAGISIDDADGVVIENVNFSGQTADITERWANMGRPIWQAAGQTTGLRWRLPGGGYGTTLLPYSTYGRTGFKPPPQYNHRFLVPSGKVETTRVFGLRSNTKLRFDPLRRGLRTMKGES